MEKFVNEYTEKLSCKLPEDEIRVAREVLFMVIANYEITPRETRVSILEDAIPEEAKQYLVTKKIEGKSDKSLYQYMLAIKRFVTHVRKPLNQVTTNDFRLYLFTISQESHMSDRSLDNQRIYISGFFKWLALNEYIERDPTALVPKIKYEKKIREPLNDTQMECLRMACKTPKEKAIVETLYSTGCRVSELVGIKISDINFDSREVILYGKGKVQRMGLLNAKSIIYIKMMLDQRNYDSEYVFTSDRAPHGNLHTRCIEKLIPETHG